MLFLIMIAMVFVPFSVFGSETAVNQPFRDVTAGSPQEASLKLLWNAGIIKDTGTHLFEPKKNMNRADYLVWLVQILGWELVKPTKASFINLLPASKYYSYMETAVARKLLTIPPDRKFNPEGTITREEAAVFLIKALDYENIAQKLSYLGQPFKDTTTNTTYIHMVRDMGLMDGKLVGYFKPKTTLTRGEAAVSLAKLYEKTNSRIKELHAFYAISGSTQMDKITDLHSVSFGWSRIQYDTASGKILFNTTTSNANDFYVPGGFLQPLALAQGKKIPAQLNVFANNQSLIKNEKYPQGIGLVDYILTNEDERNQLIGDIVKQVVLTSKNGTSGSFDGVVVDFEGLRGTASAQNFNKFLKDLKTGLDLQGKRLLVAVNPRRGNKQACFDGYDFKTIGEIADRVILMAHDYEAKQLTAEEMKKGYDLTPLTPIDEIYHALKTITDKATGVRDTEKIWFQVSFSSAQWKIINGSIANSKPILPVYTSIKSRIDNKDGMKDMKLDYSEALQNPVLSYSNPAENARYKLWYEDSRSILAKIKLARMFGINGISIWRLGNIPDFTDAPGGNKAYLDVWQKILKER
jgi:hypothetical protein